MGILSRWREQVQLGNDLARARRFRDLREAQDALDGDETYRQFVRDNSNTLEGQRRIEQERVRRLRKAGVR